jgi:hypothetical protein
MFTFVSVLLVTEVLGYHKIVFATFTRQQALFTPYRRSNNMKFFPYTYSLIYIVLYSIFPIPKTYIILLSA